MVAGQAIGAPEHVGAPLVDVHKPRAPGSDPQRTITIAGHGRHRGRRLDHGKGKRLDLVLDESHEFATHVDEQRTIRAFAEALQTSPPLRRRSAFGTPRSPAPQAALCRNPKIALAVLVHGPYERAQAAVIAIALAVIAPDRTNLSASLRLRAGPNRSLPIFSQSVYDIAL